MPDNPEIHLKKLLFDSYDGFADKRFKDLEKHGKFIVDGRTDSDIASDGSVYGWFCSMFLDVGSASHIELSVINIPQSPAVDAWLETNATKTRFGYIVRVDAGQQPRLLDLAKRVYDIIRSGKRYDVRHYKYAVPRVVDALSKLKSVLDSAWSSA